LFTVICVLLRVFLVIARVFSAAACNGCVGRPGIPQLRPLLATLLINFSFVPLCCCDADAVSDCVCAPQAISRREGGGTASYCRRWERDVARGSCHGEEGVIEDMPICISTASTHSPKPFVPRIPWLSRPHCALSTLRQPVLTASTTACTSSPAHPPPAAGA
jgi:hypothetical protein